MRALLDPILEKEWGNYDYFEYDFQAETLTVKVQNNKVFAKVFLLRSNPKFTTNLQQTLSRIYAEDSTVDLLTLGRYKFILLTSNAVVSDEMLQGLIRSQNAYSANVFVYVCHNISNIEDKFTLEERHASDEEPSDSTTSEDSPNKEKTNEPPSTYQYSLRDWFYDLEDNDGSNLIHAVYIMPKTTTIKILCERSKRFRVLQLLHEIHDHVQAFSPPEALDKIFPTAQSYPFEVEKCPKVSQACGTYANELAAFVMGNPQGEAIDPAPAPPDPTSNTTKRTRQGEPIQRPAQAPANANLIQQLEANERKLNAMTTENTKRDTTLENISTGLNNLDVRLGENDKAISKIAASQLSQGRLITTINNKQKFLERHLIKM